MRGLIIEGISNAGKTRILQRIKPDLSARTGDLFICSQALLQRMFEDLDRDAKLEAARAGIDRTLDYLEFCQQRLRPGDSPLSTRPDAIHFCPVFLADSFHLNVMLEVDFYDRDWSRSVSRRLRSLCIHTVFLRIPEEAILDRVIVRSKQSRGPNWIKYLATFGKTEVEQAEHFLRAQRRLERMLEESGAEYTTLDTGPENWEQLAASVARTLDRIDFNPA